MRRYRRALAAGLLATVLAGVRAEAQGVWTDQTIEAVPQFALTQSTLQVDGAGRPHLFVGGDRVYHFWLDGTVWRSEVVDPMPRSGERLRATIGPSGEFHLVYVRWVTGGPENPLDSRLGHSAPVQELYYATNLSGAWVVEELPAPPTSPEAVGYGQSAAITGIGADASHAVHVLTLSSGGLFHELRAATGWTFERLDSDAFPGIPDGSTQTDFATSQGLAIDGLGRVHALWRSGLSGLVYSLRDDSGWHHQPLASVTGTAIVYCGFDDCGARSLVVDGGGAAHIVLDNSGVSGGYPTRLVHLWNTHGIWSLEDLGPGVRREVTAIDPSGRLHVLSLEPGSQSTYLLRHRWQTDSEWSNEVALADDSYDGRVALAVDASGGVHGAAQPGPGFGDTPLWYLQRDSSWSAVEVARSGPVVFQSNFSEIAGSANLGADVRMGLVGRLRRLLYRDGDYVFGGSQMRHALEGDGGFQVEKLPPMPLYGVSPNSLGLALAPNGAERAVWIGTGLSESVRSDDGSWSPRRLLDSTAAGGGYSVNRPAVAFDAEGGLHAVYVSGSGPSPVSLRHAVDSSAGILSEGIVPISGDLGLGLPMSRSVAPGPLGSLQVAYLDEFKRVVHATNESGAWVSTVVGAGEPGGGIASYSLLIEPDGTVHAAFEDSVYLHPKLMYGTNRCPPGWYVTEIDPMVVPSPPPSTLYFALGSRNPDLALDPSGNPHISYRRIADRSIGYAHVHQSVWQHETVIADTSSGEQTAIAVDDAGTVSIAHHDDWAGDLRLATRARLEPEPRWDGCPPLPDPNTLREGHFLFETPPGAFPFYDPTGSFTAAWDNVSAEFSTSPGRGRGLFSQGWADSNGDARRDASVLGLGRVSQRRSEIRVLEAFGVFDEDKHTPPNAKLVIGRLESIDPVSGHRIMAEAVLGSVDGQKVKLERITEDDLPPAAFGVRLELDVGPGPKGSLVATGYWRLRGSDPIALSGKGPWSPGTSSADLHLVGNGTRADIRLKGLHVWRSRSDGVHLRANSISVRAFGQKLQADLTHAY